jgi:hypothetical protein
MVFIPGEFVGIPIGQATDRKLLDKRPKAGK